MKKSKKVEVVRPQISGPGIMSIEIKDIIKSPEAKRQIEALGKLRKSKKLAECA